MTSLLNSTENNVQSNIIISMVNVLFRHCTSPARDGLSLYDQLCSAVMLCVVVYSALYDTKELLQWRSELQG